jgi:hypothetical protein
MSKLTIGQKAQRVLVFVMGLRHAGVVAALSAHGFTEETLKRGLQLLSDVARMRLRASGSGEKPSVVEALDAFENRWFAIARYALQHKYPQLAEQLFMNITATEGAEVAISVGTFVARIREMEGGGFGTDSVAARALLVERGLTEERLAEAEALLAELGTLVAVAAGAVTPEEQQAAEQAMWAWYLEWSGIARVSIHDKRLLRALGFRRSSRGEDAVEPEDAATTLPGVPVPQLPAQAGGGSSPTGSGQSAA